MTTTVGQALTKVAFDLHEDDNTFGSGLWGQTEMIDYINYAERDFLNKTGILKTNQNFSATPGTRIYTKDSTAGDIVRVAFDGLRLRRSTTFDLDREDPEWRGRSGRPNQYHEDHLPINQYGLNKAPATALDIDVYSDLLPTVLTATSNNLNVNDEWEPYIRWKVLNLALSKDGEGKDQERATYAQARYMMGVELARRMMQGPRASF